MDSYLPKSYPSLMEGKKILYVHGFLSAGSTHTADVLRQFMPRATVLAPDLPVHPADAMALLKETVESERPDLIIGTSMGGMYTEMLYGFDRICVNPAFEMGADDERASDDGEADISKSSSRRRTGDHRHQGAGQGVS